MTLLHVAEVDPDEMRPLRAEGQLFDHRPMGPGVRPVQTQYHLPPGSTAWGRAGPQKGTEHGARALDWGPAEKDTGLHQVEPLALLDGLNLSFQGQESGNRLCLIPVRPPRFSEAEGDNDEVEFRLETGESSPSASRNSKIVRNAACPHIRGALRRRWRGPVRD